MTKTATLALAALLLTAFTTPASAGRKEDQKNAKISAYVRVINTASSRIFENRKKLLTFEEKKKPGPGCKDTHLSWPLSSTGYTPMLYRDLAKTVKNKPKTKLDKAAKTMAAALAALDEANRAANNYYRKREYKKDDCKQSAALHKKVHVSLAAYIEADREIRSFVEARNTARAGKELKKAKKKYGKRFRYYHQKIMIDAKAVLASVDNQPKDKAFDIALVEAAAKVLSDDIKALTPMAEKKRSSLDTFGYWRFYRKVLELEKAIASYIERHGPEGKPFSDYEKKQLDRGSKSVKGSFGLVIQKYNQVIGESNGIRFPSKVK